jgi:hypothetical protein
MDLCRLIYILFFPFYAWYLGVDLDYLLFGRPFGMAALHLHHIILSYMSWETALSGVYTVTYHMVDICLYGSRVSSIACAFSFAMAG